MAQQDFKFVGKTTNSSNNAGQDRIAYDIAQGNGAEGSTNGGYAMLGAAQEHSQLSGAITTCGDYCRAWKWSDERYTQSNANYNWAGMAFVGTRSLGAKLTPDSGSAWSAAATFANSTGKRTEATAISLRATVRLDAQTGSANVSSSLGSTVGLFCGAAPMSLVNDYSTHDGSSTDKTMYCANADNAWHCAGYSLMLSSVKHHSRTQFGGDGISTHDTGLGQEGVRLVTLQTSTLEANLGLDGHFAVEQRMQVCSGTYQFNKWYRIRMDVTPLPGTDKIEVYTAAATDTVGSESWTKVKTHYVFAGQSQFWFKQKVSTQQGMGYCVSSHRHNDGDSSDRNHDCFIDAFTVFSKKISA